MSIPNETFLDRLRVEHAELKDKTKKLSTFLDSQGFLALHWVEQNDLDRQYGIMRRYLDVLSSRLNRAEINSATTG